MIKFDSVTKAYNKVLALNNVNLEIHKGEFLSVVGQSGAGKSTMMSLIIGEERPDEGQILIDDIDIAAIRAKDIPYLRRKIGVVFQDIKLLPMRTAFENIAFALEVSGEKPSMIQKEVPKILEMVGLEEKSKAFPHEMSGGERQRVAIARALAHKPVLLLADEPTGNLDSINAWEIIQLLLKINKAGTTVILATHAKDIVNSVKKRVITLENGEVVYDQEKGKYVL
ncbi:MAG: cell division ATP-binding protein FtsE [Candidatus Doudnabacteria bacterium RIFCSPLOWO2_02_FULL_42_9]|uniref:Cell division ATP-binding protein FtsE n=1 Tax=Candidatus Doudnabacteria bacterium RIFCSPHIGHO2_01_FULL_41_86 TaxID=1817821 RepID=A0A1F5N880_9BACT|nr:MAG: cell division ATP-binding protein FtsE [Candidatus Doudnabacteria bacterium RIFCSPHIGHO2_01_FULL_41_86]OGE75864.1 MAG: cell division ATP-binding protein FtsE [Candidatus Doudnabacteria bacterium RIFCSPHIGHO2_01_43_10]OGE86238.1 MAG: cell division ATP-binding protein FtsE [Candidatus Doudnabacteria bacterium RIFCSPHIGHO2_12_FULL_42_22]OGE87086.1 MAG: cell division ATP-binding protein FtsE [Candidatus Doudnabacteria bacterium RIFCSPHIGHO2_02_FULL_42_25]OGE92226.1 MAG: cell division ATP-bi